MSLHCDHSQPVQSRGIDEELQSLREQVGMLRAELAVEKAAHARAEQESTSKDEYLAVISHELRSPLAAIVGWVHMLRDRAAPDEEFRTGLDVIEQSAEVQGKLIEDLLDFSRMTAGTIRLDLRLVDPRTVIDAAVESVRPTAATKRLRLRKTLDASVGLVRADATRLQQVMVNLLTNAIKFTPSRGLVEVTLRASGRYAEITVRDTGAGIAPEFLPHVFDRFRQDPNTCRGKGGLGLGLAIARELVELHGGDIRAESPGKGKGSVFTVRLPLAQAPLELESGGPT